MLCLKPLHTSSYSVEISTPVSGVSHEQILVIALTFLNFKNRWNTYMCSSSTLAINHSTSNPYPPKKCNTPVTLSAPKQSTSLRNSPKF